MGISTKLMYGVKSMTIDKYEFYLLLIDRRHNAITRAYYQIHIAGYDNHQYHDIPSLDIQNINTYA